MSRGRRRVLFTRPLEPRGPERDVLHELDCVALVIPVLRFRNGRDRGVLPGRLRADAAPPRLIAVTSRRAAEALASAAREPGMSASMLPACAAVGEATAAPLRALGIEVEVAPEAGAASLAAHIAARHEPPGPVWFLRGDQALDTLPRALRAAGFEVEELEVYRTEAVRANLAGLESALSKGLLAASVFASPSAAASLRQSAAGPVWRRVLELPLIAAGPTTAASLERAGADHVMCAPAPDAEGIAQALRGVLMPTKGNA